MSDAEIQRMVDFLSGILRERIDDDAPIAPESMQELREAARVAHDAWKAKNEWRVALTRLNVGGKSIDLDESYDVGDLDEIFTGRLEPRAPPNEARWQEKERESAERAEGRRKKTLATWLVLAVIIVAAGGTVAIMLEKNEHEVLPNDKSEMRR